MSMLACWQRISETQRAAGISFTLNLAHFEKRSSCRVGPASNASAGPPCVQLENGGPARLVSRLSHPTCENSGSHSESRFVLSLRPGYPKGVLIVSREFLWLGCTDAEQFLQQSDATRLYSSRQSRIPHVPVSANSPRNAGGTKGESPRSTVNVVGNARGSQSIRVHSMVS